MYLVSNLKNSISGMLTGINLNNVTDLNGAIERGARNLVTLVDIPEASGHEAVTLYSGVYDYVAPTTIFGTAIVDFRPQGVSRNEFDVAYKQPKELFDRTKGFSSNGYNLAIEYDKGTAILRVASPSPTARVILDAQNSTTGWAASGSASGLTQDTTVYYESPASLRFSLAGASVGTLTKSVTSQSIASYENVAVGFLAIRTPSIANLTSIAVRVGNSSAIYDEVSVTQGFLGAWVVDDFLLVAFDFANATSTGTPDWTAIDYLQVRVTHSGAITNFRVGGFWLALPSPHEILFQSPAIFMASGSNPSASITSDNDSIILNSAAYNLFLHEAAIAVSMNSSGGQANAVSQGLSATLHGVRARNGMVVQQGLYDMYRADNPSEELRLLDNWYL